MASSTRNHPVERSHRSFGLLFAIVALTVFLVTPLVAQAASRSRATTSERQILARVEHQAAPSICSKVSASAVSAIVGYTVPAATTESHKLQPTAQNFGISAVETTCTFGSQASLAALIKDVSLTFEVTSKALTAQEVQTEFRKLSTATLKTTITPYSGLGVPAFYFTVSGGGTHGTGIVGLSGTTYFGASTDTTLSESKLASLAKLARTL